MISDLSEFDAILLVSFGGPEGPDEVMPFLENVLRGKNVPRERMLEVAEHYQHFGGISPINAQNRALLTALEKELRGHQIELPLYWGNRNWHPMLLDTMTQMKNDGVKKALAFFTSAFSCYSGCRQYREDILDVQQQIGAGAPEVHKLRMFFNHPLYIDASVARVRDALKLVDESNRAKTHVVFTAHSIPLSMAEGCRYSTQLNEACRLIMQQIGDQDWNLVYQSRSGPPTQPWLEPDVCDFIEGLKSKNVDDIVVMPVGFVSDHMEVLFDLDTEAQEKSQEVGIRMQRAASVGVHPKFISMIRHLILERTQNAERLAVGEMPPNHDVCPQDCCLPGRRPASRPAAQSE